MAMSGEPVRIAFCITDLDVGGAENALVQIVTRLDRAEWEPRVICLSDAGALVRTLEAAEIPVTCLGARRWWDVGILWRLRRVLKELRPVVLQTFLYHANIAGRIAARFAGVPVVVSGIRVAERRSRFRLWLDRATERWVARHICVSRSVETFSQTAGGLSAEKTVVIPNGVDVERFSTATPANMSEFGIEADARTLLFVGRLDPQKGIEVLLGALPQVTASVGDLHVLFAGDGPLRGRVEEFASANERVHVLGQRDDVANLMRAADCLVLPSLWEGMPNVVLEARAAALPVIASNVEGVEDALGGASSGRLVPPGDSTALADAIRTQFSEDIPKPVSGTQSTEEKPLTWDEVAAQYGEVYRSLLPAGAEVGKQVDSAR